MSKTSSVNPTITKKFPIQVPTHKFYSNYAVYKIWFGKYFFIWKGKSMLQSVQSVAIMIERGLRNHPDDTNFLYHVIAYIKRARVTRAEVEIVEIADFDDKDWMKYLKLEQELLTAHKNDQYCLNNNFVAYAPEWMGADIKKEFEAWFEARFAKKRSPQKKKGARA